MDDQTKRALDAIVTLDGIARFQANAERLERLDDELLQAIEQKALQLARLDLCQQLGLNLSDLSPAEDETLTVTAAYYLLKKRQHSNANRTISQIRNLGLLEAARRSVSKSQPTQGFETLDAAGERELLYEQVVLNHPDEFSERDRWFARRGLGLENSTVRPPSNSELHVQQRSESLVAWLMGRRARGDGRIQSYTYAEAAEAIGMEDLSRNGQAFGNIQSRLDFACYQASLPPLGLTAEHPFRDAWSQQDRTWSFPVAVMQDAARSRHWIDEDFEMVLESLRTLPGQAHLIWQKEIFDNEEGVRLWAAGFQAAPASRLDRDSAEPKYDSLDQIFSRVCQLQLQYSAQNTPAMLERGLLIRNSIGEILKDHIDRFETECASLFQGALLNEGRDGTGRKTLVPWHRVYNRELSPSAQIGWYIVFLFSADGSGVYLSLCHGSTEFIDGVFKPRPADEMAAQVAFAREIVGNQLASEKMVFEIDLKGGPLSSAYERSTALSIYYPVDRIPVEDTIIADTSEMVTLLARVYRDVELGRVPGSAPIGEREVEQAIRPALKRGQGRGLSVGERKAVENRAMQVARQYLETKGYSVEDKSTTHSFDFLACSGDVEVVVEVKGTTSGPDVVMMTAKEVELHRNSTPNNALLIVHDIDLADRHTSNPIATGGTLLVLHPWEVDLAEFEPIAFRVVPIGNSQNRS